MSVAVATTHPRLWITPATLPALKARAVPGDDRWGQVMTAASQPADWNVGIHNYALAYQVTGDGQFAQRAWDLMSQSMANGLAQVTPDSGYQARNYLPAASICYDWLHDWLSTAQRAQLQLDMEACCDFFWPETNPARAGAWAITNPGSNYYQAFMFTGMAGLALAGESAKAAGYLANWRRRWDTEVGPYLAGPAKGGAWPEGLGYGTGSTGFLLWALLAHRSATGEDLLQTTPWVREAQAAMRHCTNPARRELAPVGDLAAGPINDYTRRVMLCLGDQVWLDTVTPSRNGQRLTQWEEFLFWEERRVFLLDPLCATLPGVGLTSSRTGWGTSDTQLLFVCGATRESHQDRAQGAVLLFRDTWQLGTAKLGSHSGLDQDAVDYCCLTVDGKSQTWTQDTCRLLASEDTAAYTYLKADLAGAYAGQLTSYTREVYFQKAGSYLLVRDLYTPVLAAAQVVQHWSVPAPSSAAIGVAGAAICPRVAFTQSMVQHDPLDTASTRLDLAGDAGNEIIAAWEARQVGAAATLGAVSSLLPVKGAALGASFVGWATALGASLTYTTPVTGPQALLGLKPGGVYLAPGGVATASAAGVLRFTARIGAVTVTEQGVIPPPVPVPVPPVPVPVPPVARRFMVTVPAVGLPTVVEI